MEDNIESFVRAFVESVAGRWTIAFVASVFITIISKLMLGAVAKRLRQFAERTTSSWDDTGVDLIDGFKSGVIFTWSLFVIGKSLQPPEWAQKALLLAVVVSSTLQVALWGFHILQNWRKTVLTRKIEQDPSSAAALGLLYSAVQAVFVITIVLIAMSNLGINITALLAGLGVGGVAVALAAQNILGDLLASLSIVLDKPFVVGDFVVAGNEKGTVEHIGIKTTRLRSLSGEELILSNKDLLESRIQNFKRMWRRRIVQEFGVVYSTPANVIEQIPGWVRTIIQKHAKLEFDRCHFAKYGASSLDFEFVFYVADPEYNVYMDLQQNVLLDIFRKFAEEKVEFAFPTRTIHIASSGGEAPR